MDRKLFWATVFLLAGAILLGGYSASVPHAARHGTRIQTVNSVHAVYFTLTDRMATKALRVVKP
jgi:hypothetical protein